MQTTAFKILTTDQWTEWQSTRLFTGAPVDRADGYIHLSAADQVEGTRGKHFAGQTDLVLVEIDLEALGDKVKWEVSRGDALFPHVYGTIPLEAVIKVGLVDEM